MKTVTLTNKSSNTLSFPNFYIEKYSSYNIDLKEIQFDEGILTVISNYIYSGKVDCYLDNQKLTYTEVLSLKYRETDSSASFGKDETAAASNIYVDCDNGDDYAGNGSSSDPYKTLAFLESLPFTIKYKIHVRFKVAGNYTGFPAFFKHRYIEDGKIIFDATGLSYPIVAGPFAIGTATNVASTPDLFGSYFGKDLQVTGTPGWSSDQYYGKFIHVLTGNWAGKVQPVWKNDSDTIRTFTEYYGYAPGDTFNIVDCPVTITCSYRVIVEGDSILDDELYMNTHETPWGLEFFAGAIKFVATSATGGDRSFTFKSISAHLPFCSIVDSDKYVFLELFNSQLNWQSVLYEPTFDNPQIDDIGSVCTNILPSNGAVPTSDNTNVVMHNSEISGVVVRGRIEGIKSYDNAVTFSICGGLTFEYSNAMNAISATLIEQIGFSTIGFLAAGHTKIYSCYFAACNQAIQARGRLTVSYLMGNNTAGAYAIKAEEACIFYAKGGPVVVNILGATGAIQFTWDGSTQATWPASGNSYTTTGGDIIAMK